ncbi:hypothetical protein N658DRAFT_563110 [Parathielavia hyrcaniae]|uniref:F-box domain-containing protein n=1 Tax=Parathielavia hyrcaniae TaxID=113614 RepID=A0AAN6QEX2_9PEZI|nr:hypothetical protein N658DRAFT_563110 [Parathielavia hyrcaniae]
MHFLECNEDVLLLMLGYLSRADLHAVCLAHSRLRQIAEPLLYSAIEFTFRRNVKPQPDPHPLTSLVRTVLKRPDLDAYVLSLSCKGGAEPSTGRDGEAPKMTVGESDLREPLSFVSKAQVSYRDAWLEALRQGTIDAYLAVLVSQLPRLRRLHLARVFCIRNNLIGLVLRSILCDPDPHRLSPDASTSLGHLEAVYLERFLPNTEDVLAFFYLPSLKEMSVSIDDPLAPDLAWPTTQPPSAHGLVSLRLAEIRESHLGQLLSVTPRLRSLHWTWHYSPDLEDPWNTPVINLDLLMPALAHVKDTLTELVLPAINNCCVWSKAASWPPRLRLVIPLVFFTGFALPAQETLGSCLPCNLEDLTLADDLFRHTFIHEYWEREVGHTSVISRWLADVKTSTPHLRRLCLVLLNEENELELEDVNVRNEIRDLTSRAGIELEVIDEELY